MTRSLYIVGGAGVGKSTFTSQLLNLIGDPEHGPSELVDLYSKRNAKALVTLRGHWLNGGDGIYLGKLREHHPGTDGLDRASHAPGVEWLRTQPLPEFILGEGATLATTAFLEALRDVTNLLLVHLVCDPEVKRERLLERGTTQSENFIKGTVTRSANRVAELRDSVAVLGIETSSSDDWEVGLDICRSHILGF